MLITFSAPLWLWTGKGAWHFISVPPDQSGLIRMAAPRNRGFGSVRVKVRIGTSEWSTSVFPDSKTATYLLPVKAEVRKREGLVVGESADITLALDI